MSKFNYRKVILLLADIFIITVSGVLLNFVLELFNSTHLGATGNSFYYGAEASKGLLFYIIITVITCVFMMMLFGSYSRAWRYFNLKDYLITALAMGIGFGLGFIILTLLKVPTRKIFYVFFFVIATVGVLLFRFLFKRAFLTISKVGDAENTERTLIVGAGMAGRMIVTEIFNAKSDENNPSHSLEPVGFVDDDITKLHTTFKGVEVIGTCREIPKICAERRVTNIIVAVPSCEEDEKRRILDYCSNTECTIKVIPYLSELLFTDDNPLITQAKEIKIEDLLGRKPIEFDRGKISAFIANKVCMVTGGGGSIGSELVRQIASYSPKQIIIVDIYENNAYDIQQELLLKYGTAVNLETIISSVRDYNKMETIFKKYRPQIVFHAAAHKHVPLMETVPEEAVKNNIFGTFNVATLSELYNVDKFVMISTDKAVNPTNVMGATKRACEMIIQARAQKSKHTEFVTTRFGNVLGSNGSVIPLFKNSAVPTPD